LEIRDNPALNSTHEKLPAGKLANVCSPAAGKDSLSARPGPIRLVGTPPGSTAAFFFTL
jgi:hypothetical protein